MDASEPTLTRRSLLAAGAGALAAGLIRSPMSASAAASAGVRLAELEVGTLAPGREQTVPLPAGCDLVGASWQAGPHPGLQMRFRTRAGGWSGWASADDLGHGPDAPAVRSARSTGEPLWTGGAASVQLRSRAALHGVRLHLVAVRGAGARTPGTASAGPSARAAALALATPVLAAGSGQPPIIARRVWGQGAAPRVRPGYGAVRMAFVHHTENPNGYGRGEVPAMLRAIWAFHRFVRGWNDIGYNFVVDLFGRIWEARAGGIDLPVVGAQAGGYNLVSTGVAVLGSFMSEAPSPAAQNALERLLAWKLALHGVPAQGRVTVHVNPAGAVYSRFPANARVSLPRIAGHRDGDTTDCPGNALYARLPALRGRVASLSRAPVSLTIALSSPPATTPAAPAPEAATPRAPAPPPVAGAQLGGTIRTLAGAPLAGARVVVQALDVRARGEQVSELTVGEAIADAGGSWTLPGQLYERPHRGGTLVRALYAGAPPAGAAVSEVLAVKPVPAAAPAPAPTSATAPPPGP